MSKSKKALDSMYQLTKDCDITDKLEELSNTDELELDLFDELDAAYARFQKAVHALKVKA